MNYVNFCRLVRLKTRTNTTTFPNADIVIYFNTFKDEFAELICNANEDYFGLDLVANLVADQREYPLPTDFIQIKKIEAVLDGIKQVQLDEVDYNIDEFITTEEAIRSRFQTGNPKYELFRQSIFILSGLPIINVTGGLKAKLIVYPADVDEAKLSSTDDMSVMPSSTTFGLPRGFHELLARRLAIEWKNSRDKPIPLSAKEANFERDMYAALDKITNPNLDRSVTAKLPYDDGEDY